MYPTIRLSLKALVPVVPIAVILIAFGLMWLIVAKVKVEAHGEIVGLPLLAIGSLILLLATLALVTIAFGILGLTDKTQALALPEGSIPAVIALSLIVLFTIFVVFFFHKLADTDQFQTPASVDFAKQTLTLVGTLTTSVVSFYFASKTITDAQKTDVGGAQPTIYTVTPADHSFDANGPIIHLAVSGTNLNSIKEVRLTNSTNRIDATKILSNDTVVQCEVAVSATTPLGDWDVTLVDGRGRTTSKAIALRISGPPIRRSEGGE